MSPSLQEPIQLLPIFRERVWGRENLAPFFTLLRKERIGEVWFTFEENFTSLDQTLSTLIKDHPEILGSGADPKHPGICPLLVKLLFTNSRLSVQVHPDDEYAQTHHDSLGKTEAWYILESQPPGEIAVGFRDNLSPERLREAAQSGEIEQLLDWRTVESGDVIYTPAGTVHAIGGGLTICEIQEHSDITYRLYDFGRGRELHLDHAINVARRGPHNYSVAPVALADWRDHLLNCPYFRIEKLKPKATLRINGALPYYLLLFCIKGSGTISAKKFAAGQTWLVPAGNVEVLLDGTDSEWLLTYKADSAMTALHEVC